jgi:hypothetical protein
MLRNTMLFIAVPHFTVTIGSSAMSLTHTIANMCETTLGLR